MTTSSTIERREGMLYVQEFQRTRRNQLKEYQRLRSAADHNFVICSNEYVEKVIDNPQPATRASTPSLGRERSSALLIVARVPSIVSLNSNTNHELSILNIRATSWNPQQSRITRENKDYMTALAKGLTRDDSKQLTSEHGEVFSSRWHHHLSNSVYRPGTAKPTSSRGHRPPTSGPERAKGSVSTLIEVNRPTTAPVVIDGTGRRPLTGKIRSALPTRPPPPRPPPAPLRAPRSIDASGNFDNLTNPNFLHLTDGLKPSIFKGDNHFVHQLCSNTNDNATDILNTSRESFLDLSSGTLPAEPTSEKRPMNETTDDDQDDQEETKTSPDRPSTGLATWYRDAKSGRIEAFSSAAVRKTPREDPQEIERRMIEEEEEALRQRQRDIDQYTFDLPAEIFPPAYDYKSPFDDEYDQAIALQGQLGTTNGTNDWNLKDFYRDVKTPFEHRTNTKPVFEKCIKLARLQAATSKWEQKRRQNMALYNRLLKNAALENNTSNLTGSYSSKAASTNDKDNRELNELKRELRCNECKRVTCLGNCAPGQDYHLYKRLVSTIFSASRQPPLANASNHRDTHRCKHGCTTCSASHCRTTADIMNANALISSVNSNTNRLRSSKTTYSFGQKSQRPTVDLRPRSMHQVTREMKVKFEQANLSPVVVVPLFEDESQSMLSKRSLPRATNGLLPGKSFRSQRRDSLTLISPQKVLS